MLTLAQPSIVEDHRCTGGAGMIFSMIDPDQVKFTLTIWSLLVIKSLNFPKGTPEGLIKYYLSISLEVLK